MYESGWGSATFGHAELTGATGASSVGESDLGSPYPQVGLAFIQPDDLQHVHVLEGQVLRPWIQPADLQHAHPLESTVVRVFIVPNGLQHAHTLAQTFAVDIVPEDLSHVHELEQTWFVNLVPEDLQHGHTIDGLRTLLLYGQLRGETFTVSESEPTRIRKEIDLVELMRRQGEDVGYTGLRGTWFALLLELRDVVGAGHVDVLGFELEYEPVRETQPELTYQPVDMAEVTRQLPETLYFGAGNEVGQFGTARNDLSAQVEALLESKPVPVAGVGGEAIFTNLYLAFTRANPTDLPVNVELLVDGTAHEVETLTLEGVSHPKTEIREVPLQIPYSRNGVPQGRRHPRGYEAAYRLDTDGQLPDGDVVFEGAALEYEAVQEAEEGVVARG